MYKLYDYDLLYHVSYVIITDHYNIYIFHYLSFHYEAMINFIYIFYYIYYNICYMTHYYLHILLSQSSRSVLSLCSGGLSLSS